MTSTVSEDALQHLCSGDQLWSADWEQERSGNRWLRVCDPYERRSQRGLPAGRRRAHQPARCSSLQPAEGAAEPTAAAQCKPGHGVHLLGTKQLHEKRWKGTRLQQPQAVKPAAAQTENLHYLSAQDAQV